MWRDLWNVTRIVIHLDWMELEIRYMASYSWGGAGSSTLQGCGCRAGPTQGYHGCSLALGAQLQFESANQGERCDWNTPSLPSESQLDVALTLEERDKTSNLSQRFKFELLIIQSDCHCFYIDAARPFPLKLSKMSLLSSVLFLCSAETLR